MLKRQIGDTRMPKKGKPKKNDSAAKPKGRAYVMHSFQLPKTDVAFAVPADIAKHHGDPSAPTQKSYAGVQASMKADYDWLTRMAVKGEREAIRLLQEFGVDCASVLGVLAESKHGATINFAKTVEEWPMVISPVANHPQNYKQLAKQLQLGKAMKLASNRLLKKRNEYLCKIVHSIHTQFEGIRQGAIAVEKNKKLKRTREVVSEIEHSSDSDRVEIAKIATLLDGEIKANLARFHASIHGAHTAKAELIELLGSRSIPFEMTTFEDLVQRASTLSEFSSMTESQWLDLTIEFLDLFAGGKIENHVELRKLGQPDGDCKIREREGTDSPLDDEIRAKYFTDSTVNSEIRGQIRKKLRIAIRLVRDSKDKS